MTHKFNFIGAAAGALVLSASTADAGTLLAGYAQQNGQFGVTAQDGNTLAQTGGAAASQKVVGLTYGADSYYAAGAGAPSNNITRYDTAGGFIGDIKFGPLLDLGPLAFGAGSVFIAYESQITASFGVGSLSSDLGFDATFDVEIPEMATGLAFGADSLFVAYGSHLAQYGLNGDLLHAFDFGVPKLGALAYGDGMLYAAFANGSNQGWAGFDPAVLFATGSGSGLSVSTGSKVNGLAFGDGGVFASFDHELVKYDKDGNVLAVVDTGRRVNGPLAFVSDTGAVPEPSAWLLMILGFGTTGAALRARRRVAVA
ncbi:PEPxxWA-CTERM sorting domain-containing protein [Phenylobacterium sp.]|uniref:PEPxxWA-CTERM sorting domain-containing protein n=1 Tax=Phenylobacterium sp. TaxID=1871053 RepID=UPI003D2B5319